jgi:hypothetical protein
MREYGTVHMDTPDCVAHWHASILISSRRRSDLLKSIMPKGKSRKTSTRSIWLAVAVLVVMLGFVLAGILYLIGTFTPFALSIKQDAWPSDDPREPPKALLIFNFSSKAAFTANYPIHVKVRMMVSNSVNVTDMVPIDVVFPDAYAYPMVIEKPGAPPTAGIVRLASTTESLDGEADMEFMSAGTFGYIVFSKNLPAYYAADNDMIEVSPYETRLEIQTGERNIGITLVGIGVTSIVALLLIYLARTLTPAEERTIKKPQLELFLTDHQGNPVREVFAQPTYVRKKKVPGDAAAMPAMRTMTEMIARIQPVIFPFGHKEPGADLVPIGIEISNVGEAPAESLMISIDFPEGCELLSKCEAAGGLPLITAARRGLFVDSEEREAWATVDILGNDLTMKDFDQAYVRFPEKEESYRIGAKITQHNFPPEEFTFMVHIKPKIIEELEYGYEEQSKKESSD